MATGNKNMQNGRDLMLFVNFGTASTPDYKAVAFATSHTLTINTETVDISSKDHGRYGASEAQKLTWSISSENLYSEDYNTLFDQMKDMTAITVKFGLIDASQSGNPDAVAKSVDSTDGVDWTVGTTYYTGDVFITSLTLNAANGEKATYSVELTGTGKITKATA